MAAELPPLPHALRRAVEEVTRGTLVPKRGNPGLVWERYPRVWSKGEIGTSKERKDFLPGFTEDYGKAEGSARLGAILNRMGRLGERRVFRTTGPFVTGLGADHPTESGFEFDRMVGVPILAGSALKGLARAAAVALHEPASVIEAQLGTDLDRSSAGSGRTLLPGAVTFLGGWPERWPALTVQVATPHHPVYQEDQRAQKGPRRVASYMEEPVPVTFLALAPDLRMALFLRRRGDGADLERVWAWIAVGLQELGIGAKTSAGFGRMVPDGWSVRLPERVEKGGATRVLVSFAAPIGGRTARVDLHQAAEAADGPVHVACEAPPSDVRSQRDPRWWNSELARIRRLVDEADGELAASPGSAAGLAVAALAPQPLLIALGWYLGDAQPVDTLLLRRDHSWGWAESSGPEPSLSAPIGTGGTPALLVSLSGTVDATTLPPALAPWSVWEIRVPTPELSAAFSRAQRQAFREAARRAFEQMSALRRPIHVFPAMPAALAVDLGCVYLPRAWPSLSLWDRDGDEWLGPFELDTSAERYGQEPR